MVGNTTVAAMFAPVAVASLMYAGFNANEQRWQSKAASNILIAVLVREQEIIIPEGSTAMQAGDRVIVISKDSGIRDLNDIYRDEVPVGGAQ